MPSLREAKHPVTGYWMLDVVIGIRQPAEKQGEGPKPACLPVGVNSVDNNKSAEL